MMEVKGKKKFTGKNTKLSQEKNRFYKNSGKITIPEHAPHVVVLAIMVGWGCGGVYVTESNLYSWARIRIKIGEKVIVNL
jgi:hypothetical protein